MSFDTGILRAELDPQRPRLVETPWGAYALFLLEGQVVCAQAFCPHMDGPLFQGTLAGERVTCPWHGWIFSLRSGERLDAPDGGAAHLRRLAVELDGEGRILLRPPAGAEADAP